MKEQWRPIRGYTGKYEVSNLGRVRSLARRVSNPHVRRRYAIPERLLTPVQQPNGYVKIQLWKDGKSRNLWLHRIVAAAFHPRPRGAQRVNHLDFDPGNNRASNLQWATHGHDVNYSAAAGRMSKKLTASQVREIRRLLDREIHLTHIAALFDVSAPTIASIREGKTWRWV